ncbi:hypothetical protein DOJK_02353 [Patescibacteria group bacterium]|nr:hypothetical protein DOJK_02353 [Patescibacteria group bacterium]
MMTSLRLFLVVALVLLQCVAPLVHAHTHEDITTQGIHLPELEMYAQTPKQPVCQAVKVCHDDEGMVVGVNAGVSRDMALPVHDKKLVFDCSAALVSCPPVIPCFHFVFFTDLFLFSSILSHRIDDFVHAPRAPPVLA